MEYNLLGWIELITLVIVFTLVAESLRVKEENKIRKAIRRKSI